jgi:MFS family permease
LSAPARASALAPFKVRSFRFQWPADLATSWAFEMETLILGWYVLVETQSVFMLTVFASLLYVGTLLAPMFGVMGDRVGQRNVLCAMRALYATLATILMALAFMNALTPAIVLAITAVMGLVRPSDIGVRAALVGETMPAGLLMGAMSVQRTTLDSARIAGALTGAGLVAALGIGPAYAVVAGLYAISAMLTLKSGGARAPRETSATRPSPWRDLKEGLAYVWNTPHLLAMMCLAFLCNLTAFPLYNSLLPVVAKEVYHTDQTGLGYLVAGAATGALIGSIILSRIGHASRPGRMMIAFSLAWYSMLLVFAHTQHPAAGIPALMMAGAAQSLSVVSMAAALLRTSDAQFHGRIMGIRMLVIYGNLPGILGAGPLIASFGYPAIATLYCVIGLVFTVLIAVRWRAQLWRLDALANTKR